MGTWESGEVVIWGLPPMKSYVLFCKQWTVNAIPPSEGGMSQLSLAALWQMACVGSRMGSGRLAEHVVSSRWEEGRGSSVAAGLGGARGQSGAGIMGGRRKGSG